MSNKVKEFYDTNYEYFNITRVRIWHVFKNLILELKPTTKLLEAGCGNGKNLEYFQKHNINSYGIDFSKKLLDICKSKNLNVKYGDIRNIPYPDNYFDCVISPAVVHHLKSEKDRIKSINEMIRVCKPNCKIIISIWAVEQEKDSKRKFKFKFGDNLVPWREQFRYYYIYDKLNFLKFIKNFNVEKYFWEKGNWYFIIIK